MESTKEVLVVKSDNLLNENAKIIGGFRGGIVYGSPLFPLPKLTQNFGRTIKFSIKSGTYSLRTFVGDDTVTKDNCLGIYLQDNSGNELQSINSPAHNGINKVSTFTVSADVASKTTQLYIFFNHDVAGRTYEEDTFNGIMINSGDTGKDYEPYYREYESTKEVLIRRSNNLFLPFTSNSNMQIDVPFSWGGTDEPLMTCTLQKDGNIRMRGTVTKGVGGGYVSITNLTGGLVFKAGKTYNFSIKSDCQCTMQLFRQKNGAWETIYQFSGTFAGGATKTFTEDTIPTRIFMNFSGSATVKAGDEIDVLINPMLVEGDTKQDYEPYYYEAEASKTGIIPDDGSLTSVVDFSNAVKGKELNTTDGVTLQTNDVYAYTPDYFPCETGDIFKFTYVGQENIERQTYRQSQIMWYDANKNFLSSEPKSNWGAITFSAAPANAKFFRLNYSGLKNNNGEWMFPSNPKLTKVTS